MASVLRSPVRGLLDDVSATMFPGDCRLCEAPLERVSVVPVCAACVGRVEPARRVGCGRCGEAMGAEIDLEDVRFAGMLAAGLLCRECRMAAPPFARAVSYGTYDGELRGLIGLLKFHGVRGVAGMLGARLVEAVLTLEGEAARELTVIAVPLHPARERQRGYNQSVLLADAALRGLKRTRPAWRLTAAHGVLVRERRTESSYVLSRRGRRLNLRGAFCVLDTGPVKGREVLLVDDILTSGATARECARVLLEAGAAKVWVATLARAQKTRALRFDPAESVAVWDMAVH